MHGLASIVAGATFEGRYDVLAEIGSGGFGTVYQARQRATGQLVAIKVLRWQGPESPSYERRLARFLREMRLCARLHHPNIVRLIDSGHTPGGPVYTVFEFVPGQTLDETLVKEGVLDPVEARHLMMQVLDGLACAHAAGIVHRDLKPKNIMVTGGARRNALVLDFGIGAITGDGDEETEDLTATGELVGSPGYAAPEQFLRGRPSPRSDLFSWALVFVECLTGVAAEPVHRLVLQRLDPTPIALPMPLSEHPLGEILRRALVKDVSAREVSAEALLRQLEACDVRDLPLAPPTRDSADRAGSASSRRASTVVPRWSDTAERTSASAPAVLRRERRQVTAVCSRIELRPTGTRAEDLENADEQLDFVQRLIAECTRRLGGWVVGVGPDTIVGCFGYPTARNDDAVRAGQAALAIQGALRQSALAGRQDGTARVAIGVHTGLVMARDTSEASAALGPLVGMTLRVAAELASSAKAGAILVSGETRRLTEAAFDYERASTLGTDAAAAKLDTHLLHATRSADAPTPASVRQTPLVGRQRDLALILDLAERARRGTGQAVFVHGEAGIGKSRLLREVVQRLQGDGFSVVEGRSTPDTTHRALHACIDLLERSLDLGNGEGHSTAAPEDRIRTVEALAQSYGFEPREAVPLFAGLLGIPLGAPYQPLEVSSSKLKEMTRDALFSLFLEMADTHPLVLVFEDLHWSDASTRDLLAKLAAEVSGAPLLLLMTGRPEFVPAWSPSSVVSVGLDRLGRQDVEQLVAKITQGPSLPAPLLDRVIERADGVPLFVEELVLTLVVSGDLVAKGNRYELAKPLSDLHVPTSLRGSLTARLDRLGRAKHTAQMASVIGREFRLDVLTALAQGAPGEIEADLEILVGADLVHGRRSRRAANYTFKHALICDAAYELLPKDARQQAHARLAKVLETQFPEITESRPELLAKHHAAARQMTAAIAYAKRTASAALVRSANAEVIACVEEALPWVEEIEGERERATAELELMGLLTMAQMATYGYGAGDVAELVARCQKLLPAVGEGPLATGTRWATLMYHHMRAEREEARSIARALVGAAEEAQNDDLLTACLAALGQCFYIEGNLEESRKHLERALALYDPQRHRGHAFIYGLDSRVYAQSTLGLVLWLLGERKQAWAQGQAAIEWAREIKHAPSEAVALLYFSGLPHYEQDRAKVLEVTEALTGLVDRYGLFMYKAFCGVLRGWAERDAPSASRHLEAIRATGQEIGMSYFLSLVAECEAESGALASALARVDEAIHHAKTSGELYYMADLLRLRGTWLFAHDPQNRSGGAGAAEAALRQAIVIARERSEWPAELSASLALGRILLAGGRKIEARDLVDSACKSREGDVDWKDYRAAEQFVADLSG